MAKNWSIKIIVGIVIFSIVLSSCASYENAKMIRGMLGKAVSMPKEIVVLNKVEEQPLKVISYISSTSCTECYMKTLPLWGELKSDLDSLGVSLHFVVSVPKGECEKVFADIRTFCPYCAYVDFSDSFGDLNPFVPEDARFHTFLLDGNNVVRLVGDPRENEKLWKLYLGEIERLKLEKTTTTDQ